MIEAVCFVGRVIGICLLVIVFAPFALLMILLGSAMLYLGLEPPDEHKEWLLISLFIVYAGVVGVALGRLVFS